MTKEEIARLAMLDAETESLENLRAAAGIYDRLIRSQRTGSTPIIVQNDISGTPLPNGSLHWFGYCFEWADLPDEPLLREDRQGGFPPRWVGSWPGFTFRTATRNAGISDARSLAGKPLAGFCATRSRRIGRKAIGRVLRYAKQTYSRLIRHGGACNTLQHPLCHR